MKIRKLLTVRNSINIATSAMLTAAGLKDSADVKNIKNKKIK